MFKWYLFICMTKYYLYTYVFKYYLYIYIICHMFKWYFILLSCILKVLIPLIASYLLNSKVKSSVENNSNEIFSSVQNAMAIALAV